MKKLLTIVSVICYGFAGLFIYNGFDKMMHYYNSDNFPELDHNSYVGGDAYNYIINGSYAIAYFVLALVCVVLAATMLIVNKRVDDGNVSDMNAVKYKQTGNL